LVTKRRGEYSARLKLVPHISASECSSWPTVTANEDSYRIGGDSQASKCLSAMARRGEMSGLAAQGNHSTHGSRPESWATPQAEDTGRSQEAYKAATEKRGGRMFKSLKIQVKTWATPQTRDNRSGGAERWDNPNKSRNLNDQIATATTQNAKLNPRWVETLMGLPVGWTMPSCQSPVTIAQTNCASLATE
jgi:hypothetical protein